MSVSAYLSPKSRTTSTPRMLQQSYLFSTFRTTKKSHEVRESYSKHSISISATQQKSKFASLCRLKPYKRRGGVSSESNSDLSVMLFVIPGWEGYFRIVTLALEESDLPLLAPKSRNTMNSTRSTSHICKRLCNPAVVVAAKHTARLLSGSGVKSTANRCRPR